MKEIVTEYGAGPVLRVFPYLSPDADDRLTASAGCVEAKRHWPSEGKPAVWGVDIRVYFAAPMTRRQSDGLQAAINRCWEWIEGREAAVSPDDLEDAADGYPVSYRHQESKRVVEVRVRHGEPVPMFDGWSVAKLPAARPQSEGERK